MVEITRTNRPKDPGPGDGLQIIRDIAPYRAVGGDIALDGKRPVIGTRRQHREYLARNAYVEVGNERPIASTRPAYIVERERQRDIVADLKRAAGAL